MSVCDKPDCDKPVRARGLCNTHYQYDRRHNTLPPLPPKAIGSACSVPECEQTVTRESGRGLCGMHYQRLRHTGTTELLPRSPLVAQRRVLKRVKIGNPTDCWPWTGPLSSLGYGTTMYEGVTRPAHRVVWMILRDPSLSSDLDIDHVCRNRACCNPDHLEPVTHRLNTLRGVGPFAVNARKTHCKWGHEFTEENIYRKKSGARECRACKRKRRSPGGAATHPRDLTNT